MLFLLVAIGGALGGVLRYLVMTGVTRRCGEAFPWGTLAANVLGSFLLGGVLGTFPEADGGSFAFEQSYALLGLGFCGGLTTFSTFSLQNLTLVSKQKWRSVAVNMLGSLVLCMLCAALGYALCERWTG